MALPACLITCSLYQSHTGSESSSNSRKEMLPKPITIVTSESSSTCFVRSAAEDLGFGEGHAVTIQTPAQVFPLFYLPFTLFRVNILNKTIKRKKKSFFFHWNAESCLILHCLTLFVGLQGPNCCLYNCSFIILTLSNLGKSVPAVKWSGPSGTLACSCP